MAVKKMSTSACVGFGPSALPYSVSCGGANDGYIVALVFTVLDGNHSDLFYLRWTGGILDTLRSSPAGTDTDTLKFLSGGAYFVDFVDSVYRATGGVDGCSTRLFPIVPEETALVGYIADTTHVACNGDATGSARASAVGGIKISGTDYTYNWSTTETGTAPTHTISTMVAGNYAVTIIDNNGCRDTVTFTITEPPVLTAVLVPTNPTCNAVCNGSIDLTPGGGAGGFTFAWTGGQTLEDPLNLCDGLYIVTVTDLNQCTLSNRVTLAEPTLLVATGSATNVTCPGGSDGQARVSVTGGTANFTYHWSNPFTSGPKPGVKDTISNLTAATYTVTVVDAGPCTAIVPIIVTQPTIINTFNDTDVTCNGVNDGSIKVTTSGGAVPYTYHWVLGPTSSYINGLSPAWYPVTSTDANSCIRIDSVEITQPVTLNLDTGHTDVVCNGDATGTFSITATGGSTFIGSEYAYHWSTSQTDTAIQQTRSFGVGTYTVTAIDSLGCNSFVTFNIFQPNQYSVDTGRVKVSCNGGSNGSLSATATGNTARGGGTYIYAWSTGGRDTLVQSSRTGLPAGTYTLTILDANLCDTVFTFVLSDPSLFTLDTTANNVSCFGGSDGMVSITATGATPFSGGQYTYSWNFNTPNTNTGVFSTETSLAVGTYVVTVTDSLGCDTTFSFTLTQPSDFSIDSSHTEVTCNAGSDGSFFVTATGGTPSGVNYFYHWSFGGQRDTAAQASDTLAAGTYAVTIKDSRGCDTFIVFNIHEPLPFAIDSARTNVTCNGGNDGTFCATITAGGTTFSGGQYIYSWSTGASVKAVSACLNNLAIGSYALTVIDSLGCRITYQFNIIEATDFTLATGFTNPSCNGGSNGTVSITATGATPYKPGQYIYQWAAPISTRDSGISSTIINLAAGNYSVTVTDSLGCDTNFSFTLVNPAGFVPLVTKKPPTCNGSSDGSIRVSMSGATPYNPKQYIFQWVAPSQRDSSDTTLITGLIAGTYNLTIIDSLGCDTVMAIILPEPAAITWDTSHVEVSCNGGSDGIFFVTATGGTSFANGDYIYRWSFDGSRDTASQASDTLAAGTYAVTITDSLGCDTFIVFNIHEPLPFAIDSARTNVTCNGGSDGTFCATITAGGNTFSGGQYIYSWSTGASIKAVSACLNNLAIGSYVLTVIDSLGCRITYPFNIIEPTAFTLATGFTNPSCNGGSNGTVSITATGATPYSPGQYIYQWAAPISTRDSGVSSTIINLGAGTYSVTVTDSLGCDTNFSFTLVNPAGFNAQVIKVRPTCNSSSDGSIRVSMSGATPYNPKQYIFDWPAQAQRDSSDTTLIVGLVAGTYTVTITDSLGCDTFMAIVLTAPGLFTLDTGTTITTCFNGNDGTASATVTGGGTAYSGGAFIYKWATSPIQRDSAAFSTATGLAAGTVTLTVTDSLGCDTVLTFTIREPAVFTFQTGNTPASCNGGTDGTASVTVSGGTTFSGGQYRYSWSNGTLDTGSTSTITGLLAGNYCVTITDSLGCDTFTCITVLNPSKITTNISRRRPSCIGDNDGTLSVTATGATPYIPGQYIYQWVTPPAQRDSGVFSTIVALAAGNYTVTITDSLGCDTVATFTLPDPPVITIDSSKISPACNGNNNGSVTVTGQGGVPFVSSKYIYSWASPLQKDTGVFSTITGLVAGTYTVTVTDSLGCDTFFTLTLAQPSLFILDTGRTHVSCNGGNNGTASATATGAVSFSGGTYYYYWSNGQKDTATTSTITGLTAGTYCVTITDSLACDTTICVTVKQPTDFSITSGKTNVSCNSGSNGSICVTVTGATPFTAGGNKYYFHWGPPSLTKDTSGSACLTGLIAGTYTVTILDSLNCDTVLTFVLTEPTSYSVDIGSTNASCNGATDGTASITATGATPFTAGGNKYYYYWSDSPPTRDTASSSTASNLAAGVYTVTVLDSLGCDTVISFTINEPPDFTINITRKRPTCNGSSDGSLRVSASGAIAYNPSQYIFNWVAPISQRDSSDTSLVINLIAGTYNVTITDSTGCDTVLSIVLTEPSAFTLDTGQTNVVCNGESNGTASITATGATPFNGGAYYYYWSTTDKDTGTSSTVIGLAFGTHTVTVLDSLGCDTVHTFNITQPDTIGTIMTKTDVVCNGDSTGTATVSAFGGTTPYTYSWNTVPSQNSTTATGLYIATWYVTVTDANNCTRIDSIQVPEPTPVSTTTSQTDVLCNGDTNGVAIVTPSGGIAPYTYAWSTTPQQTDSTATALYAGQFCVTVTDANGCTTTTCVTITQPNVLTVSVGQTNVLCNGESNGTATATASNGTAPYQYSWSNTVPLDTDSSANGLAIGVYCVSVQDANGCTLTSCITITQPDTLKVPIAKFDVLCNGDSTGWVAVTPTGGTTPYTYSWNTGLAYGDSMTTGLPIGTYTVTITDANGCDTTNSLTITQVAPITATFFTINANCDSSNGIACVTPAGGYPPYTYVWENTISPTATDSCASGLASGVYTVTVTDDTGCVHIPNASISDINSPVITIIDSQMVSCNGGSDGYAVASASGGSTPYHLYWLNFAGDTLTQDSLVDTLRLANRQVATYTFQVTDSLGCTRFRNIVITEPAVLTLAFNMTQPTCFGRNDGSIIASGIGGATPYKYKWVYTLDTDSMITNLIAGNYTITIIDANGCITIDTAILNQPDSLIISFGKSDVRCKGEDNGLDTAFVTGGIRAYTYTWSSVQTASDSVLTGLSPGTYFLTVIDANSCTATNSNTIVEPDTLLALIASQVNVSCYAGNNGSATASGSGGNTPYTFHWITVTPQQDSIIATGLTIGTYTVSVSDNRGCFAKTNVVIIQPDSIITTISGTNIACNGDATGTAQVTVTGGVPQFTYNWSPSSDTGRFASGLSAGSQIVSITDANGCIVFDTIVLTEPPALVISTSSTPSICGDSSGIAYATPSGGVTPYIYLWSSGNADSSTTGIAGLYTVTVTDANICTTIVSVGISDLGGPTIDIIDSTNVSCNGLSDGDATVSVLAGNSPFRYLWTNGDTTVLADTLSAGPYIIEVTDSNGCKTFETVNITEPATLTATNTTVTVACYGDTTGQAKAIPSGGTTPYSYGWAGGGSIDSIINLAIGSYPFTVTDANGCVFIGLAVVGQSTRIMPLIGSRPANCNGASDGTASVTGSGGTTPYSYFWPGGGQTTLAIN
ncbi:SprB repeat-containing protein, partial [bacterium AH-315-C07]|nr:SprB repeat-containing protein [bacterium AH-315-C07]